MSAKPRFFLTTAISYPNGKPHLGHAYELIAADAIARFMRLDGRDVFFLTGTDEHGLKMVQTAEREGIEVRALADRNAQAFRDMGKALGATNDDFIRTTEARHYASCQEIWRRMEANGDIYLSKYSGWYSVRDESFFDESELSGEGDKRFAPSGAPVEWVEEESYFFRLSKYQDKLLAHYVAQPDFIGPDTRKNEVVSFVSRGLDDLSISRKTFTWGIPVPGDDKHVMYVWVDALTNYITACGFPDEQAERYAYWPASLHLIGKDIVRFHAVIWPAMLMSAGLPLPKRVFGHGHFLARGGEKMSKSLGNVVDPFETVEKYGLDAVRYFALREVSFGQDGSYSHEAIVGRLNADLANDLGNLAQRSLSMVNKNCDAKVPAKGPLFDEDKALLAAVYALHDEARAAMGDFALHTILNAIWKVVGDTNRYFAGQAPWALKKTDPARMETVLWVTAEVLRVIGLLTQPFIPLASVKLLDLLAVPADQRAFAHAEVGYALKSGTALPAPTALFPRYVEAEGEGKENSGKENAGKGA